MAHDLQETTRNRSMYFLRWSVVLALLWAWPTFFLIHAGFGISILAVTALLVIALRAKADAAAAEDILAKHIGGGNA